MADEAQYLYETDEYLADKDFLEKSHEVGGKVGQPKQTRQVGGETYYRCTRCGQYKPKTEFYTDTRVPCGIRDRCKVCYGKIKRSKQK